MGDGKGGNEKPAPAAYGPMMSFLTPWMDFFRSHGRSPVTSDSPLVGPPAKKKDDKPLHKVLKEAGVDPEVPTSGTSPWPLHIHQNSSEVPISDDCLVKRSSNRHNRFQQLWML